MRDSNHLSLSGRAWVRAVITGFGCLLLLLFLAYPMTLACRQDDIIALYQVILFGLTMAGGFVAAYFYYHAWQTSSRTLQSATYNTLSNNWNVLCERIANHADKSALDMSKDVGGDEWERARPLVQEILTTFDNWLVQNELRTFPRLPSIDTWDGWYNTIVGYFVRYPLLVHALYKRGGIEYSRLLLRPWEEAVKELKRTRPQVVVGLD